MKRPLSRSPLSPRLRVYRAPVALLATAVLLVGAFAEPGYVEGDDEDAIPVEIVSQSALALPEAETPIAAGPRLNPAGCVGRTHDPHASDHQPGTVNVVGDTVDCRWEVDLGIRVRLYRSRWSGWQKRGDSGVQGDRGDSIRANAASPFCAGETHDWLGSSYHESTQDGNKYTSTTSRKRPEITC